MPFKENPINSSLKNRKNDIDAHKALVESLMFVYVWLVWSHIYLLYTWKHTGGKYIENPVRYYLVSSRPKTLPFAIFTLSDFETWMPVVHEWQSSSLRKRTTLFLKFTGGLSIYLLYSCLGFSDTFLAEEAEMFYFSSFWMSYVYIHIISFWRSLWDYYLIALK